MTTGHILDTIVIAVGLSMDALAVSIAGGAMLRTIQPEQAIRTGSYFGGFQALMPIIGWSAGFSFRDYMEGYARYAAFAMLFAIGLKMIYESSVLEQEEERTRFDPADVMLMLGLAVATSIDALAVGVSYSVLGVAIIFPAAIIGVVTFATSVAGVYIGSRAGHIFENRIELAGGLILMAIGIKILLFG